MKDKLTEIIYIKANMEFESPVIIGSGENENSDRDVFRDKEGNLIIHGSTLSGILRSYTADLKLENEEDDNLFDLFGARANIRAKKYNRESTQSALIVYDSIIKDAKVVVRDGVKLIYKEKIAEDNKKFDYEIIEPLSRKHKANFELRLELVIREEYDSAALKRKMGKIIEGLKESNIMIGAKTRRGFGQMRMVPGSFKALHLDFINNKEESTLKWIDFDWNNLQTCEPESIFPEAEKSEIGFININARFNIEKSILIRTYANTPDHDFDYQHIKSGGRSVIPGTSWAGTFRHHIYRILDEMENNGLGSINKDEIISDIFGNVEDKKMKIKDAINAKASKAYIFESKIKNSFGLTQNRVKIDRFTGEAVASALYSGRPEYKGNVELNIKLDNSVEKYAGLFLIAIDDISNGITPIGGETSIGRGIMSKEDDNFLSYKGSVVNEKTRKELMKNLFTALKKGSETK